MKAALSYVNVFLAASEKEQISVSAIGKSIQQTKRCGLPGVLQKTFCTSPWCKLNNNRPAGALLDGSQPDHSVVGSKIK
jgi:hypothetical protein